MKPWMHQSPAEQVAHIMTRIYERRMTTPSGGNISLRDQDGSVWVTPSQIDKGSLQAKDMVCISPQGGISGTHKPTMEYRFHQGIYRVKPNVRAVIHAHPADLVALSLADPQADFSCLPVLDMTFTPVGRARYALPGSAELGETVAAAFADDVCSVLMENHGIITTGADLQQAYYRLENLQHMAAILICAARLNPDHYWSSTAKVLALTLHKLEWPRTTSQPLQPQQQGAAGDLIHTGQRTYQRGLFTAVSGCYSMRLGADDFLISPQGGDWLTLDMQDVVRIEKGFLSHGERPSRYAMLHRRIYQQHPFINAIATGHPVHLMAYAVTSEAFASQVIPESYLLLGRVSRFPFETLYRQPDQIAASFDAKQCAALLDHEAVIITGNSLFQVFDRLEVAENTAASLIAAQTLGSSRLLTDEQLKELREKFAL